VESKVCYNKLDRCVCHGQVLLKLLNMKLKENSKEKEKDRDSELESGIERIKL